MTQLNIHDQAMSKDALDRPVSPADDAPKDRKRLFHIEMNSKPLHRCGISDSTRVRRIKKKVFIPKNI